MYAKQLESETQSVLKEGGDTQTSRKVDKFGKQPQLKISNCTDFEKTSCRKSLQIKSDIFITGFERNVHQPNINALLEIHQRDSGSCTVLTEYSVLNNSNNKIRKGNVPFDIHKQVTISNTRQPLPNQGPGH